MNKKVIIPLLLVLVITVTSFIPSVSAFKTEKTEETVSLTRYNSTTPVLAAAEDFDYSVMNKSFIRLNSYKGSATSVIIPETIDGLPVEMMTSVFSENHKITYVKIPSTVTNIGIKAFYFCDSLLKIDVDSKNETFTSVDGVLYSKDKTKLVYCPGGREGKFTVPDGVEVIGDYAFDHCYGLTEINMYNSVTKIGSHAFSFCWNAEKIRLSDRLLSLGAEALSHCDSYTEIHLPATLTSIGEDAFLGQTSSVDGSKEYYFTDGIYCVPGTYSYNYVKNLGVVVSKDVRSITDIDTGIVLYDSGNKLPSGADLEVERVNANDVKSLFNVKYTSLNAFDISLSNDGASYNLKTTVTLNFEGVDKNAIKSASKVYKITDSKATQFVKMPQDNSIEAVVTSLGRFAVLSSNSFTVKGDADGDGVVSSYDALVALCASLEITKLTPEQIKVCDVTGGDGKVFTSDARAILRCAAGIEVL